MPKGIRLEKNILSLICAAFCLSFFFIPPVLSNTIDFKDQKGTVIETEDFSIFNDSWSYPHYEHHKVKTDYFSNHNHYIETITNNTGYEEDILYMGTDILSVSSKSTEYIAPQKKISRKNEAANIPTTAPHKKGNNNVGKNVVPGVVSNLGYENTKNIFSTSDTKTSYTAASQQIGSVKYFGSYDNGLGGMRIQFAIDGIAGKKQPVSLSNLSLNSEAEYYPNYNRHPQKTYYGSGTKKAHVNLRAANNTIEVFFINADGRQALVKFNIILIICVLMYLSCFAMIIAQD